MLKKILHCCKSGKKSYELLVLSSFFFWPLKKVCFETEILGSLFRYIFLVLFFCLLLRRPAVRISLPLHIFLQKILTQTKSPIPPSPQKANGQPLRGWGKKRILNLSKCYPSTNGWRAFVMWWFSRLKYCLCWGGTFLGPLSQIWRSTGFCFRTHVIFHVYCPACLCNQTARHFLSLLYGSDDTNLIKFLSISCRATRAFQISSWTMH